MRDPLVIAVSGWAFPEKALAPLLPPLAAERIRLLRSFPPQATRMELARNLSAHSAFLVGWSMGAMLALEAAAKFSGRVAGLFLISATARFCAREPTGAGQPPAVLKAMRRRMLSSPATLLRQFYAQCFLPGTPPEGFPGWLGELTEEPVPSALATALDYLMHADIRDRLGSIRAPTFLVHGSADTIVPPAAAQDLASALRHCISGVLHIGRAGHALPFTHRRLLQKLLSQFLR